jgi:hypothetical protein
MEAKGKEPEPHNFFFSETQPGPHQMMQFFNTEKITKLGMGP